MNQSAIFALLPKANRAHHQARGFDRACLSNCMGSSRDIELTSIHNNTVIKPAASRVETATPPQRSGGDPHRLSLARRGRGDIGATSPAPVRGACFGACFGSWRLL